jgi:polysaccharide export outer membrane protein
LILTFTFQVQAQTFEEESYKVGVNDVINIKVLGHKDLSTLSTVAADGTIALPYLGNIYVKDKSLQEIEEEITKKLAEGYINNPVVSVSLIKAMSKKIFILGEAMRPGVYPFEKDLTIVKALALAGGITESGLYGKVKVRRKQENGLAYKNIIEADLDKGILKRKEMEDILLQPDDILIVERNKTFFIEGEVVRPGQYVLEDGMTVSRAITVAGGITEGGLHGKVKVRRKREKEPGYDDIEIDLKGIIEGSETGDMLLQPDDIVRVERNKTIIVYGEVGRPGEYPLEDGMTVFKALVRAGGFSKWGSPSRVKVLRPTEDGKQFTSIKVDIKKVLDGDPTKDLLLQPGDIVVVSPGLF